MSPSILDKIIIGALMVISFIIAICVHEWAHGFVAYKLGDNTAKKAGRLTLNPIKSIDPVGTVLLPGILILSSVLTGGAGIIFGYAKPVPYNPRNFKNLKQGEVLVGISGPLSNILLSLVGAIIAHLGSFIYGQSGAADFAYYIWYFGSYFTMINLCLAFFNLIPIPPLDGASLIALFLPRSAMPTYYKIQQYSMFFFLLIVIVIPYFTGFDIFKIYLQFTAGNISNFLLSL